LESYCRHLVSGEGKNLFIVAGPIGEGGKGKDTKAGKHVPKKNLPGGKVAVPAELFKVIMVVEDPTDGSNPQTWVNNDTRLIAVIMANDMNVPLGNWPKYRVSVDQVEKKTGFTFFKAVEDKIKERKMEKDTVKIKK